MPCAEFLRRGGSARIAVEAGVVIVVFVVAVGLGLAYITHMPDVVYAGPPGRDEPSLERLSTRLETHVERLSTAPGGRNTAFGDTLTPARDYIARAFGDAGLAVTRQDYEVGGTVFANLEVELAGATRPDEVLIVGAHYDSVVGSPGANDNGSGVAALLELARIVSAQPLSRGVRFVAFCNEEPPYFGSEAMGSNVYASTFPRDRLEIVGMISLETIGYYSDAPGSQKYPPLLGLFYPDQGNFLAFVGNLRSRRLVVEALALFRRHSRVPSEGIAAPASVPGVSWSDQWSFWRQGDQAIMITDTAPYRYPDYHRPTDTPDKIDYRILAAVVEGLGRVIVGLANRGDPE